MSYDLDEDISILNINELDEAYENCRLDDPQPTNSSCRQEVNRIKELNALFFGRLNIPRIKSDRNKYSAMSRPEDLLKELHELRENNLSLQQECTSLREGRLSAQKECLQLREKVSFLFRENCSLKEQSAKLTIDNRALQKQVESLKQGNTRLRDRLQQFSCQLKGFVQNKDICGNSLSSPVLSYQVEQVKLMLEVINNLPKCVGESKDSSLVNDKKDIFRTPQGSSLFSLELDHENIEQISHKLLEHLQQEKKELEQQYSQMVEVQRQTVNCGATDSLQSCLNLTNMGEKEVLVLLETCRNNSKRLKQEAMIQNNLMTAMVKQMALSGTLKRSLLELNPDTPTIGLDSAGVAASVNDNQNQIDSSTNCQEFKKIDFHASFSKSNDAAKASTTSNMDALWLTYGKDIPDWETSDTGMNQCKEPLECTNSSIEDDRVCPMCQAVFPKRIPLQEFEAHVMEHFKSEEFEIITQDNDYG